LHSNQQTSHLIPLGKPDHSFSLHHTQTALVNFDFTDHHGREADPTNNNISIIATCKLVLTGPNPSWQPLFPQQLPWPLPLWQSNRVTTTIITTPIRMSFQTEVVMMMMIP